MKQITSEFSPIGHYSAGVISNGILYVSGQTSADPETNKPVDGGIKAETKFALKKVEAVLNSANVTKNDVVMCKVYISDIKYWAEVNEVYSDFFGNHKPARAVIPTRELNRGCLIELEVIAEVNK